MDKPAPFGEARAVPTHVPQPKYTEEALEAGIQGTVGVRAFVDETGVISEVVITHPLGYGLDLAALEALAEWRFRPAMKREFGEARPTGVWINLQINFRRL